MSTHSDDELERLAAEAEGEFARRTRALTDFRYDEQQGKYWDTTTGILLAAPSVDGAIPHAEWPTRLDRNGEPRPVKPSIAINDVDTGLTVEGSTWWPGKPRIIEHLVVTERGTQEMKGACTYNSYIAKGRPKRPRNSADPWLNHIRKLWPEEEEHEHFFDWAAHMVQRPHEKTNHGIVLAGRFGIGKDTALLPLRNAVGEWNTAEVAPDAIVQQYNGYVKSTLLVINEVRPHDEDFKASNFYNLLKPLLAAPPAMLPMNLKYANTIYVRNLMRVVLTTNEPLTMFIPEDDRRLFVMTSPLGDPKTTDDFESGYFDKLYLWLNQGGIDDAAEWLWQRDLSRFDPNAPPKMTAGKAQIIASATQVRRTLIDDVIESFLEKVHPEGPPEVIFHRDLSDFVNACRLFDSAEKVLAALNAKNFHYKMADRGYSICKNQNGGEWRSKNFRSRVAFVRGQPSEVKAQLIVQSELKKRPLFIGEVNDHNF